MRKGKEVLHKLTLDGFESGATGYQFTAVPSEPPDYSYYSVSLNLSSLLDNVYSMQ